jgi:hypothetical protein
LYRMNGSAGVARRVDSLPQAVYSRLRSGDVPCAQGHSTWNPAKLLRICSLGYRRWSPVLRRAIVGRDAQTRHIIQLFIIDGIRAVEKRRDRVNMAVGKEGEMLCNPIWSFYILRVNTASNPHYRYRTAMQVRNAKPGMVHVYTSIEFISEITWLLKVDLDQDIVGLAQDFIER